MNNKRKQLTILTIALSLPLSAIAITTLSNNRFAPATKPAAAMSYVSTEYDGYRRLSSQYGIMENVDFVIAYNIQVMANTSVQDDDSGWYITHDTMYTSGSRIATKEGSTAIITIKPGKSGQYILNKKGSNSNIVCTNNTESVKFSNQTTRHNTWSFNYVDNGEFTLGLSDPQGGVDYLGYRNWTSTGSNSYYGFRHANNEANPAKLHIYVDVQSVIDAWATKYLAWGQEVEGQCVTKFDSAKEALDGLGDMFKTCLSEEAGNADYLARYQAWAKALGKSI